MNMKLMNRFMKIMSNANRPPEKGVPIDQHAAACFKEFNTEIRAFMKLKSVDNEILAMIGNNLELQWKGARSSEIKVGILKLMIDMAGICFAEIKDKEVLAKVEEKKTAWQKEVDETTTRMEKLKTLSPDDILNAPVASGIPNN